MRLLFGLTLSPILQGGAVLTSLRSHPLIDSTGWCRCVPLSVSTSHQFEKVSWWSNEWTTGKGIRSKSVLVVQRVDHRAKVLASYRSHPLTDSEGWFRFDVPSVPPPHRFGRVVPMRKRRPMGNPSETPSAKEWRRLTGCLTQTYVKTTWGCSRCLRCTGKGETAAKLHVKTTWGSSHCPRCKGKGETKAKPHVRTMWGCSRCLRGTGKGETKAKLHVKTTWGCSRCLRDTGKGETAANRNKENGLPPGKSERSDRKGSAKHVGEILFPVPWGAGD